MKPAPSASEVSGQPDGVRQLDAPERALLDALLAEAPVAFALYDLDLRWRRINRALAETNGLPVDAHLGRRPTELLASPLGEAIEANLRRVLETGEVISDDDFTAALPGTDVVRHWESQWYPARDESGRLIGVAVMVTDVTERRRAETALRRSQARTERLQQATSSLSAALTVGDVADVVAVIARSSLGASRCELAPAGGVDSLDAADRARVTDAAEGTRAVVPLRSKRKPLGLLVVSWDEPRALEAEERVFLEALAGQCALALERALLFERERHTAEALQRSLLPPTLPEVPGVALAAAYLPGLEEARVGGDWYDAFTLPGGRLAVVVGDVMGKGVSAAAGMGRMRSAVRALAYSDPSPAAVLTGLDRLFTATEAEEQITTLVYAVLDPATGILVAGDAGHLPLVHARRGRPAELVDVGGGATPLGLPERRGESELRLEPGDTLVAYTDGLVESRQRGIGEGLAALADGVGRALQRDPGLDVDVLLTRTIGSMNTGEGHADDVTVLGVRWLGPVG
jgi:PAS domain S-box-containing protein